MEVPPLQLCARAKRRAGDGLDCRADSGDSGVAQSTGKAALDLGVPLGHRQTVMSIDNV